MAAKKPKEDEASSSSDEEEINETEIKEAVENSDEEYLLPPHFFAAVHETDLNTSAIQDIEMVSESEDIEMVSESEDIEMVSESESSDDNTSEQEMAQEMALIRAHVSRDTEQGAAGEGMRLAFALFILFIYLVLRR